MTDKIKIKVIKKDAVKTPVARKSNEKRSKTAAREMVSNVTNWVTDFQQRKRDETKLAIEQLFAQRSQPNES